MLRAASNALLIAAVLAIAVGCGDPCEDAEDACRACGRDNDYCRSQVATCELLVGPAEDNCCDSLLDGWDGC